MTADHNVQLTGITIQETEVAPGEAQRRPGLHVDSPGSVKLRRGAGTSASFTGHHWGAGCCHVLGADKPVVDIYKMSGRKREKLCITFGGIYLASSVAASCRVWNCGVAPEAVGPLGVVLQKAASEGS